MAKKKKRSNRGNGVAAFASAFSPIIFPFYLMYLFCKWIIMFSILPIILIVRFNKKAKKANHPKTIYKPNTKQETTNTLNVLTVNNCPECGNQIEEGCEICPQCNHQISITDNNKPVKHSTAGKTLGILSIIFSVSGIYGLVLGIVGLSVDKEKKYKTLNTIGVAISSFFLTLYSLAVIISVIINMVGFKR